jgi:hypothetical protein
MIWFAILGLVSLAFILTGSTLAVRRVRRYQQESEMRRVRAFAQMQKIAEEKKAERTLRSRHQRDSGQGTQNAGETVRRDD